MSEFTAGKYREWNENISGALVVAATDGDTVLKVARNATTTIFIQKIIFWVTTDAAQSISFEDTASTPVSIAKVPTSPGTSTRWEFDFGAKGRPLTEGKNFNMNVSAAGLAGSLEWEGYQRLTSATALSSAA